ncbi:hypothetical protein BDW71DRAFT_183757 [Aspergillus fruticulosus]
MTLEKSASKMKSVGAPDRDRDPYWSPTQLRTWPESQGCSPPPVPVCPLRPGNLESSIYSAIFRHFHSNLHFASVSRSGLCQTGGPRRHKLDWLRLCYQNHVTYWCPDFQEPTIYFALHFLHHHTSSRDRGARVRVFPCPSLGESRASGQTQMMEPRI